MLAFTIKNFPLTFTRISEADSLKEQLGITTCALSVWEQASYHPHVLSDIGLDAWATYYAKYCHYDELLQCLKLLKFEMLKDNSISEQYYSPEDPEEDYCRFVEGKSIKRKLDQLLFEVDDPHKIIKMAVDYACDLFKRLYGISMTESQQLDTLDFIRDFVGCYNHEFEV